jgi:hypothetical protein
LFNKETHAPAPTPGDTDDDDDNGHGHESERRYCTSNVVRPVQPNDEPSGRSRFAGGDGSATPQYAGTLDDDNVNETVDFGFVASRKWP